MIRSIYTNVLVVLLTAASAAVAADCDDLTGNARYDCLAQDRRNASVPPVNSKEDAPGQPSVGPAVPRKSASHKRSRTEPPPVPSEQSQETAPGQPPAAEAVRRPSARVTPKGSKPQPVMPSEHGPEAAPGQSPQSAPSTPPRTGTP